MIATWRKTSGAVLLGFALLLGLTLLGPSKAAAQAEIPFYANVEVEPNVLFVMDISGSMNWDFQYIDGAMRTRMDAAKKILTGEYGNGGGGNTNLCPEGWTKRNQSTGGAPNPHCRKQTHNHHGQEHLNMGIYPDGGGNCPPIPPEQLVPGATVHVDHGVCHQVIPTSQWYSQSGTRYAWIPYPPEPPTQGQGIIDSYGGLLNFAFTVYSGNGDTSTSNPQRILGFPGGIASTTFENGNTTSLKATILAQSASGNTPTTQAMRDAGCWIIGEQEMNKAFLDVATSADPDIPFPTGGEQVSNTLWVNQCPNVLDDPHVYDCSSNQPQCDPSFSCRRTFILLLTDGEQTSGWGHYNGCLEGASGSGACRDAHRKIVASALRRSKYLNDSAPEEDRGVKTFVALMAPCNLSSADANGNGTPDDCEAANNALVREGDMWAKYGGTDATPDPDDCTKPNNDGGESFLGTSAEGLEEGIRRALACILEGNHTRAEPTFIASSTNFAENLEIDGYFSIEPGEAWWRGHLDGYSFEQINNNDLDTPVFDAGRLLTDRTNADPRTLYVAIKEPFTPAAVTDDDPTSGAQTSPVQQPSPTSSGDVLPFTPSAAKADLASIVGKTESEMAALITFLRDEDGPSETITSPLGWKKTWALGAIVNSSPVLVRPPIFDFRVGAGEKYADFISDHAEDPDILYVGAQDGFLHAFALKDSTGTYSQGEEIWGFMPYEAVLRMPAQAAGTVFTVDGTPQASTVIFRNDPTDPQDDEFRTVLIFGLRSGGFSYVALDITDPTTPQLLWQVTHPSMGRTFSRPNIAEYVINWDGGTVLRRSLVAMGAGFNGTRSDGDPIQVNPVTCASVVDGQCLDESGDPVELPDVPDDVPDPGQPGIGNWLLFWDIETGRLIQNVRIGDDQSNPRFNSVPGDVLALDRDLDGAVDNVIFGDVEGRLWKILTYSQEPEDWWTDQRAADDNLGDNPALSPCVMFDQGSLAGNLGVTADQARRPIFYAPAATFDCNGFLNLIWGTGDLTNPNDVTSQDFLFAINDPDVSSCGANDTDMSARDFTCEEIQDSTFQQKIDDAFPFALEPGEKILSAPLIIDGKFYVTTYQPGESGCGSGGSRFIIGPAICCRLQPKNGDSSADVLEVYQLDSVSPPLIVGPDGRPMSIRAVGKDKTTPDQINQGGIKEIQIRKRNTHWVDVFGSACLSPTRGGSIGSCP